MCIAKSYSRLNARTLHRHKIHNPIKQSGTLGRFCRKSCVHAYHNTTSNLLQHVWWPSCADKLWYDRHLLHVLWTFYNSLGNLPIERAKDVVCFLQWCGLRLVSVVSSAIIWKSDPLTRLRVDPSTRWPFQKRTPQGQFRGPPTYSHHPSRCSAAKLAFCSN